MHTRTRLLIICAMLVACYFVLGDNETESLAATYHISLDRRAVKGSFPLELLGANVQWTSGCDGLLTPGTTQLQPAAIAAAQQLGPPTLRYPGGLLASIYSWRNGIGALGARSTSLNYVKTPELMYCGSDEYAAILQALSAKGMITANLTQPPSEAAAWLSYLQSKNVSTPWWEVGNESYLPDDPSYTTAAAYGTSFIAFSKALKAVDPSVKVGAILEGSLIGTTWGKYVIPEENTWNAAVVSATAATADFYSLHLYAPFGALTTDDDTVKAIMAAPVALAKNMASVRTLVQSKNPKAQLFVTEFNVGMDNATNNWRFSTALVQAGYVAQMVGYSAVNGISQANFWSMVGNNNFGLVKSWNDPRLRPSGLLYKALKPMTGADALSTTVNAPLMSYKTVGNVPSGMSVPAVWAQSFTKGSDVWVLVVNRTPKTPFVLDVRDAQTGMVSTFSLWVLGAATAMTTNEQGDAVKATTYAKTGPTFTLPGAGVAIVHYSTPVQ
ncbi:hypothetical protein [Fundidesulfovibrio soli]|uniref:hypothetical protein n=1 Tax=Fundidesulfovibrio soli TaxID=2922716 RepID=UPI001FAF362D|nr:hypothetical protein [Fundidesulfovibrio soli]